MSCRSELRHVDRWISSVAKTGVSMLVVSYLCCRQKIRWKSFEHDLERRQREEERDCEFLEHRIRWN